MSAISIHLRHCARTFANGSTALHPLDLDINAGETLVLLGPSGCGKTTTLRLISGLETPNSGGQIRFGEENVTRLPIEKRDVGMVFQNYALFPNMNVADNVAYGLKIKRLPAQEIRRRIEEMLAMMHIEAYADRAIHELSGGQKQRVALARAMAVRPRVLLFDEPLAALDAKLRDRLRIDIGQLLRQLGTTAIYVTHDQAEAMALGDRIAVMEQGRIAQIGTPREIYHHPANTFVANFIGTVNRLEPTGVAGSARLSVAGGWISVPADRRADHFYCRPEDIRVCATPDAPISGKVVDSFFLGQSQRLLVDTGAEQLLQVDSPARQPWQRGDRVGLEIPPEALFTLPEPGKHQGGPLP
ncbi:ABC transporter ATP-binding protein [Zobellella taiwanensis]